MESRPKHYEFLRVISFLMKMSLRSGIGFIELIELIDDGQLDRQLAYI